MKKPILFKPLIGYLNINFLRHKIDSLGEILKKSSLEIICVDETKLDECSQEASLKLMVINFHHLGGIGINMEVGRSFILKKV